MNPSIARNAEFMLLTKNTTGSDSTSFQAAIPVDMQGYVGATFIFETWSTQLADGTGTATIKEGATTSAFVSLASGSGTAYTTVGSSTSAELIVIDVFRPKDRYLQADFASPTEGDLYSVKVIKYLASKAAVSQSTAYVPSNATAYVATPTT